MKFYSTTKLILDLFLSLIALFLLSPILVIISITIKISSIKEPIFYIGKRTSINGGTFNLYKFRTMKQTLKGKGGFTTSLNDPRLTKVGSFLRAYKLDELPQLLNVINGDMSLVGPRPQFKYYTDKYRGENLSILTVKPGITDLASLMFINLDEIVGSENVDEIYESDIEPKKNELRLKYVKERSFLLDIKIITETILRLIGLKGLINLDIDNK